MIKGINKQRSIVDSIVKIKSTANIRIYLSKNEKSTMIKKIHVDITQKWRIDMYYGKMRIVNTKKPRQNITKKGVDNKQNFNVLG